MLNIPSVLTELPSLGEAVEVGIFISAMPMAIQMISRTRQMMLTKMPRAAESPKAAMESTKPPSWTPICMGRKPMRLANSVVKATMSTECR